MNENTDKELLELAAKAMGLPIEYRGFGNGSSQLARVVGYNKENGITAYKPWNPLEPNSGDALQLAVKLHLFMDDSEFPMPQMIWAEMAKYQDMEIATCRAIVQAAAEIGKQL